MIGLVMRMAWESGAINVQNTVRGLRKKCKIICTLDPVGVEAHISNITGTKSRNK